MHVDGATLQFTRPSRLLRVRSHPTSNCSDALIPAPGQLFQNPGLLHGHPIWAKMRPFWPC